MRENLKEVNKIVKEIEEEFSKMGYSEKEAIFKFRKPKYYSNAYEKIQDQISKLSRLKINNKNLGKIKQITREIKKKFQKLRVKSKGEWINMTLTTEFRDAVQSKNMISVKIMLKDGLLLDEENFKECWSMLRNKFQH